MKRYEVNMYVGTVEHPGMVEHPEGKYVTYSDHMEAMEEESIEGMHEYDLGYNIGYNAGQTDCEER